MKHLFAVYYVHNGVRHSYEIVKATKAQARYHLQWLLPEAQVLHIRKLDVAFRII